MLRQFEANKDPNKTVTLLKAVQWTRVAWCDYVSSQTIQKCFWKSTITTKPDDNMDNLESAQDLDMDELRAQIAHLPRMIGPLSVEEFIEVPDEVIDDNDDDVTAAINYKNRPKISINYREQLLTHFGLGHVAP
jgi:hypothetical protein